MIDYVNVYFFTILLQGCGQVEGETVWLGHEAPRRTLGDQGLGKFSQTQGEQDFFCSNISLARQCIGLDA